MKKHLLIVPVVLATGTPGWAQVSSFVTYSGRLTDGRGWGGGNRIHEVPGSKKSRNRPSIATSDKLWCTRVMSTTG